MYYCNINGFKSKQDSITNIIKEVKPHIFAMCETKLANGQTINKAFPDYEVCTASKKTGQKGLAIGVKRNTFKSVLDVTNSTSEDIIAVRIEMAEQTVRIILAYGPQETDPIDIRDEFFTDLEIEVAKCKIADELPIVVGDLNAKITKEDNNLQALSSNGKYLLQLVNNQQLDVLNFHERCKGKWTHVIRTTNATSVLDYILAGKDISSTVQQMIIDEECLLCPFSVKQSEGTKEPQFSDHNAIVLHMEIRHERKTRNNLPKSWRITDEGLQKLAQLTNEEFDYSYEGADVEEQYDKFEGRIGEIMDECFQIRRNKKIQTQIPGNYSEIYKKITAFRKKGKAQRHVANKYINEIVKENTEKAADAQKKRIQTALDNLTINSTFSPNKFWELCKTAKNSNNNTGMSVETEDGHELFGEEMILDAYSKEFKHRLRKREISEDLKNYESQTELLCQLHLENVERTPPYSKDELEKVRKHLRKGKSSGRDNLPPEIFINGGEKFQDSTLEMFNNLKSVNEMPKQWTKVQISTIYKNKGKKKRLINQRGIFLKQVMSKMYEKLNMNRACEAMATINKCQAGGQQNRSTADQTYLLRAAIDHCKYLEQPLYVTLYDYSQCFDSLWLTDSLLSLLKVGVDKEIVSILQRLNETCNIVVKTPVGTTEEFEMTSIVQQGSVSGGALCTASTAEIANEDLGKGYQIGTTILKALVFVDDIATLNNNHQDTYQSHRSVEWFSDRKRLLLNALKCLLLCINTKNSDVTPRLKIGNNVLKTVESAPYLGDIFNSAGNNDDLIIDRVKKGKACTVNSLSLCAEITLGIYSIPTLLLLFRSVFMAVVLYNAQAWSNLTSKNIHDLQVVQLNYLKRMLHAPRSTSNAITFLETGVTPIENEIHIKQLTFLHHIITLDDDDPVKTTYHQQLKYVYEPNWANNVEQLKAKYGILETEDEMKNISREQWKNSIKRKVRAQVIEQLKLQALEQKYGQLLTYGDKLQPQQYLIDLPSTNARKMFHIRSGSIDLKTNRPYKYGEDVSCRLCKKKPESVNHVANECVFIEREDLLDIYSLKLEEMTKVSRRCIDFQEKVDELES